MFPSVETQQLRYHQMIFDQRAKTHKNLVLWYKRKLEGMTAETDGTALDSEAISTAYRVIAHHAEAAGMTTVSTQTKCYTNPPTMQLQHAIAQHSSAQRTDRQRLLCRTRSSMQRRPTPSACEHVARGMMIQAVQGARGTAGHRHQTSSVASQRVGMPH